MVLDPNAEFNAPEPVVEPVVEPKAPVVAAPPAVTQAQFDQVKGELESRVAEIEKLKGTADVVDKLREVFSGKSEDPRDAFVKSEIRRLIPQLDDLDKIKQLLPVVLETLGNAAEEKVQEKAGSAVDLMRGLMKDAGLDEKDDESVGYMEEVLTRVIKGDPDLKGLWARGNVKAAVSKAFDKAQGKLFAPIRAKAKRSAVSTITESPRAFPRTNAPSPGVKDAGAGKVDINDTSREGRSKVHDAAFDRLQELLDR